MLFIELRFFLFFFLVFSVYWSLRNNDARKIFLLAASYFFYGCWDWRFVGILAASTTMDYTLGIYLTRWESEPRKRRLLVAMSVVANLSLIAYFKYCNFFIESAAGLLTTLGLHPHLSTLKIIIPVGVSFYTFQSLSYTLEVYRGHLKAEKKFLDLAFFVAFFPQLVAGPIVRAMAFLPQTKSLRKFADVDVRGALVLFLVGFVKKACVADGVAESVDKYFSNPGGYTAISAWIGVLLYAVQIFCDFSGYTDMALAVARLLGYELTINFNFPYFARSVTDFWRRWHISLSSWLRDYLYISLGGNRGSKLYVYRNLFLTMLLGGLWHGSRWTFAIWGALHGIALIVHREWSRRREPGAGGQMRAHESADKLPAAARPSPVLTAVAVLFTFYWTCITWIFFRCADLTKPMSGEDFVRAKTVLNAFVLFHSDGKLRLDTWLLYVFAALAFVHWLNYKRVFSTWWRRMPDYAFAAGYGATAAFVLLWVPAKYAPFIYFQF